MTREGAIGNLIHAIRWNDMPKKEALDMAIKALEQEPCGNTISRQTVLDLLNDAKKQGIKQITVPYLEDLVEKLPPVTPQQKSEDIAKAFQLGLAFGFGEKHDEMDKVIDEIKKVITPQPQTGYWEWMTEDKYRCSNCNYETRVDECMNKPMYDFCPFCGVKMVQESEEV